MLYLLNYAFGMYGIVWSQIAADVVNVVVSVYVYWRFERSLNRYENK